jgi:hypothetical protein
VKASLPQEVSSQRIAEARAQLKTMEVPAGIDADTFSYLRNSLDAMLAARMPKGASQLPDQSKNTVADAQVVDDGAGGFNLTWTYKNIGDYGGNGVV